MVGSKYVVALVILCFAAFAISGQESNKLAILVGADWAEDTASRNDVEAMDRALRTRGFTGDDIVSLSGNVSRTMLISFLTNVRQRTSGWKSGTLFLYYSGHGTYHRVSENDVAPGAKLNRNFSDDEQKLLWHEVFDTLKLPPQVKLVLLPDN